MHIEVTRYSTTPESTLGVLYIDGVFRCYTLEDTQRAEKVRGSTRIHDGLYRVELRNVGGMTQRYTQLYGTEHVGMLWLREVPEFEYVYIHTGNASEHTDGCILVGDAPNNNILGSGFIGSSRDAYWRIYPVISKEILRGRDVTIRIRNIG